MASFYGLYSSLHIFTCLFNENQHHYEYNFYFFSPSLLDKLLWKPFNEDAHASNLTFLLHVHSSLRSLLLSYLEPIRDDSISSASSFDEKFFGVFGPRRDSNRGSPDLIHDELDHRATVPCKAANSYLIMRHNICIRHRATKNMSKLNNTSRQGQCN